MKLTFSVIALCVLIFVLQLTGIFSSELAFMPATVSQEPWTLITSMFMHGGTHHLMLNMIGLFTFGMLLENLVDNKRWIILYFTSGFIASFGYMLLSSSPFSTAVGASGAIFGLMGGLAVLKPRQVIYTMYGPLPMLGAAILWGAIEFFSLYNPDNIAHSAHLFGLLGGVILAFMFRRRIDWKLTLTLPAIFVGAILVFSSGMPNELQAYQATESCELIDYYESTNIKYAQWSCENSFISSITYPSTAEFNLAKEEEKLSSFAGSEISRLKDKNCILNKTYIGQENKTAILNGIACNHTFYSQAKICDSTEVLVLEIGLNRTFSNINCSNLVENVSG